MTTPNPGDVFLGHLPNADSDADVFGAHVGLPLHTLEQLRVLRLGLEEARGCSVSLMETLQLIVSQHYAAFCRACKKQGVLPRGITPHTCGQSGRSGDTPGVTDPPVT